jgi:hypothetical protein
MVSPPGLNMREKPAWAESEIGTECVRAAGVSAGIACPFVSEFARPWPGQWRFARHKIIETNIFDKPCLHFLHAASSLKSVVDPSKRNK